MDSAKPLLTFSASYQGKSPLQEDHVFLSPDRGIFTLADGFGGAPQGPWSSQTATEEIKRFLFRQAGDPEATFPFILKSYFSLAGNALYNAVIYAHQKIVEQNKKLSLYQKGGASVISGFIDGTHLSVANVGACSGFLLRKNQFHELVVPKTSLRAQHPFPVKKDLLSFAAPYTCLGMYPDLDPEIFEFEIQSGDTFIFTTQGFFHEEVLKLHQLSAWREKQVFQELTTQLRVLFDPESFQRNASIALLFF